MHPLDRMIGGLRCRDVLDALPDFVAGALGHDEMARALIHLSHCRNCERFGGEYAAIIGRLREDLAIPSPAPEASVDATLRRIRDEG